MHIQVRCRTPQRKLASMASFISAARRAFLRPRDDLRRVGEWVEFYRRSLSALDPQTSRRLASLQASYFLTRSSESSEGKRFLVNFELIWYAVTFFPQVKDLDCEGLFGNIESVLKTSQKLLTSLENAVDDTKGNDQELGNVLIACLWMLNFAMV